MGSVQFQIAPRSSLHFSVCTGPFWCSRCYRQGFSSVAPVPSEAVPFVYLACLPVSSVSHFHPDTGGRRWPLVQVRVFSRAAGREGLRRQSSRVCGEDSPCSGHTGFAPLTGVCSPRLRCSGSRLLCVERALRCSRFQFSGSPQKHGLGWACVLCLPRPSSSGSREPDGRTLPGAARLLPSAGPASVSPRTSCVCLVSVLGSWSLAATLPADDNHPESQEVFG